jgi:hypothetical protein
MNHACFGIAVALTIAGAMSLSGEGYNLKVTEYRAEVFALWGDSDSGPWHESYDGIVCEVYENDSAGSCPIQTILVVQNLAADNRLPWPETGSVLSVETFDLASRLFPVDEFTIAFDTLIFRK